MRINHTGEVCAQALYAGQASTAKLGQVRESMEEAAAEERDHLAWCETRLSELQSRPSLLNPLWYAMSFGMGAAAGLAGDKWSLGFVAETEKQVCEHLESHLEKLPEGDHRSKAVLTQMIRMSVTMAKLRSRPAVRHCRFPSGKPCSACRKS